MEGKGYRTLSDVLNGQTSINTGAAGYGKIDIRGQGGDEADRNLVFMVDGVPLNNMSSHPWSLHYDVVPVKLFPGAALSCMDPVHPAGLLM